MDEKEIYEICMGVDSIIADKLTESIVIGTSYDMLEATLRHSPDQQAEFLPQKGDCTKADTAENGTFGRRKERTV